MSSEQPNSGALTGRRAFLLGFPLLLALSPLGCSTTSTGSLSSPTDFPKVFEACKLAVVDAGFGLTAASSAEGFISGQRGVWGGVGVYIMNVHVARKGAETSVHANVVPPAGDIGETRSYIKAFSNALRNRVPDVAVVGF